MPTRNQPWRRVRVERGVYRQPNGKYAVCVMIEGRPHIRTVATTLPEARRQRELLCAAAGRGELALFPRLTFAEAAARWLSRFEAKVAAGERRERTLEIYRYHLNAHVLPSLGRRHLQSITPDHLAELVATLQADGLAPRTIAGALVPLGSILRFALRRGYIADNPLRKLERSERPTITQRTPRVLARDELRRFLTAAPPRYRPLLATAAYTGMRLSELLALTWGEVDFAAGLLRVRCQLTRARRDQPARRVAPKTRAAIRDIPLAPQLARLLSQHKHASAFVGEHDYVFATGRGTPLGHRNVERRALARAAERAGLHHESKPRLRFHDLRHTFASHLIVDPAPRRPPGQPDPRPRQHEHHPRHLHPPLRRGRPRR